MVDLLLLNIVIDSQLLLYIHLPQLIATSVRFIRFLLVTLHSRCSFMSMFTCNLLTDHNTVDSYSFSIEKMMSSFPCSDPIAFGIEAERILR